MSLPDERAARAALDKAQSLTASLDAAQKKVAQLSWLRGKAIWQARQAGVTPSEIARELGISRQAVAQLLDKYVEAGL